VNNGTAAPLSATAQTLQALLPAAVADTTRLADYRPVTEGVWGRTGFDLATPWTKMHAKDDGTYAVRLPETGRLELWLGHVEAGYVMANGTLRTLPVGSSLVESRFAWTPPAGYTGPYHLVFVRGGERIDVTVTVVEKSRVSESEAQIRMRLDDVALGGAIRLSGWAFDPQASMGSGIGAVHVWATRVNDPGTFGAPVAGFFASLGANAPLFLGAADLDQARPDVVRTHAQASGHSGFALTSSLPRGTYLVTAYAWNERTARWEDARSVLVVVR